MADRLGAIIRASIQVKEATYRTQREAIEEIAQVAVRTIRNGGKILLCGNGGSAGQAQHLAAEIICRYKKNRRPLAALALSTDTSVLTAISNDFSYEDIFAKQIEGLATKADLVWVLSTSGKSPNIIKAVHAAKKQGCEIIAFTGEGGGDLPGLVKYLLRVPSTETDRIQETHITIGHAICERIEDSLD